MSEEGGFGITFGEKFFGFLLLVIGSLALYYVLTSTQALGIFTAFFGFLNVMLMALGLILIIAKTE
jgi:hypothetical protein